MAKFTIERAKAKKGIDASNPIKRVVLEMDEAEARALYRKLAPEKPPVVDTDTIFRAMDCITMRRGY